MDDAGQVETWEYQGGAWDKGSFVNNKTDIFSQATEKDFLAEAEVLVDTVIWSDKTTSPGVGYNTYRIGKSILQKHKGQSVFIQALKGNISRPCVSIVEKDSIETHQKAYNGTIMIDDNLQEILLCNSKEESYMKFLYCRNEPMSTLYDNYYKNSETFPYRIGDGYSEKFGIVEGTGFGDINISGEQELVLLCTNEDNDFFIMNSSRILIAAIKALKGRINIINLNQYADATYLYTGYSTVSNAIARTINGGVYVWKNSKIQEDAYVQYLKTKVNEYKKGYACGILHQQSITFSIKTSNSTLLSQIIQSGEFTLTQDAGIIVPSGAGITNINDAIPDGANYQLMVSYDLTNLNENHISSVSSRFVVNLLKEIPYRLTTGNESLQYINIPPGKYKIDNVTVTVVNTDFQVPTPLEAVNNDRHLELSYSLLKTISGFSETLARYSCGTMSLLPNRKLVVFGDSIMQSSWALSTCAIVAERLGLEPVNLGRDGSSLFGAKHGGAKDELRDEMLQLIPKDVGVVVMEGGTNDYTIGTASIGEIYSDENQKIYNTDRSTMLGSINYAINYIFAINPCAIIVLLGGITTQTYLDPARPIDLSVFNEAFKKLADARGDILYAEPHGLVNKYNVPYLTLDGVHPKLDLSIRYASAVINALSKVIC